MTDIIVVGGGAAGMMAAIVAARLGRRVILLEAGSKLGRKILVSGNGRCNLTNLEGGDPRHYHGTHPRFVRPVLERFAVKDTLAFFRRLGVECREETRGRLFPLSDQARCIVAVLEDALQQAGVQIRTGARVVHLEREREAFVVRSVDGERFQAPALVVATGGCSAPQLGADTSGLDLVESLGHERTGLMPGLVPLVSPDPHVRRMQGSRVQARVSTQTGQRGETSDTGDLLFTSYGVSGPTVLYLSTYLVPLLAEGPRLLEIDFFPDKSPEQLSEQLKERWSANPHRTVERSFAGWISPRVAVPLLRSLSLPGEAVVRRMTRAQRWTLAQGLHAWPIRVTEPHSLEHAEVTIGGISTGQVDPFSLQSHLVPGLYLAGEALDVNGDWGGFNFQWAWSSGWVAGQSAAVQP